MKGTLTFHLPLERGPGIPPEMTIVIRREAEKSWLSGVSVCSKDDQFIRRKGRGLAFSRLLRSPFQGREPKEMMLHVYRHLHNLRTNRPGILSDGAFNDTFELIKRIGDMRIE